MGPDGFARATGVTEESRTCQECHKEFRATASRHGKGCPYCGSPATVPVVGSATAGAVTQTPTSPHPAQGTFPRIAQ